MTDTTSATPRRRNATDRAARRTARQRGTAAEAPAFIRREIPYYELISDDGLAHIEAMSDRLLSEIGMDIRNDQVALDLFRAAGAIAQAHAEVLVGVALTQLTRPGAPAIYGNFLSSMALRSGSPTFGTPEPALGSLIVGQLARRAKLPLRCSGAFTASMVPDGQAMTVSMLAAIQCGANFILHSAGWPEGGLTMGYEKFMMDADFCSALHTYCKGIDPSDEQFALDAFHEVGPGKHFFGSQHTMRHYETAFWDSATANNDSFEQWRDAGETRVEDRANARMRQVLTDYEMPPMDDAIDDELRSYVSRHKADRPDMWY